MYTTRPYDVRLLLAAPGAPALWDYAVWQSLVPALTPLLSSDRGRTSLRMHQIDTRNIGVPNQAYVRFGQIGWNDKSHRKWTHSSPDTAGVSGHWVVARAQQMRGLSARRFSGGEEPAFPGKRYRPQQLPFLIQCSCRRRLR